MTASERTPAARRTARRVGAVALVALVVLATVAGPAAAASGSVELDAALDSQREETTLSFTFTARANETVTADGSRQLAGGDVVFEFEEWEAVDGSDSGSSESWTVEDGTRYEVSYEARATSGASERQYSWTADVRGGATSASETLYLDVNLLEPRFGGADSPTETVIFRDDDEASEGIDVGFENDGRGAMVPESVDLDATPSGIDVSVDSLSNQVDGGGSGTLSLDAEVESSVSSGTYTISGTITDNLGNSQSFTADLEVRKPPVVSADDVDVGGVLRGNSKTVDVTVSEVAGFSGTSDLDVNVIGASNDGSVVVDTGGFSVDAGESDTIEIEVQADSEAEQHAPLEWQVQLTPSNQYSPTTTVDVDGEVFYPPNLESLDGESAQNTFDVPRSEADVQETETEISFENTGDLEMDVSDVSVRVDSGDVTARVADAPDAVDGLSTGSATVVLAADPDAAEGTHPFTVSVDAAAAGEQSITRELTIEHVPELSVDREQIDLGDVTVTNRQTTSIDVSEVLEYESVSDVRVVRTDGPERYLEIVERPTALEPGESAPLVFAVGFNTSAELYQVYQWEFEIRGDGVETQTVTVAARPTPYSFDSISNDLGTYAEGSGTQAETAAGMVDSLEALESQLRDGQEVPSGDLTETIAAGETAVLLLNSLDDAEQARAQNGSAAAQEDVLRARATLNAMRQYVDRIDSPRVSDAAEGSLASAREATARQVDAQVEFYESRRSGDATTLQRASASRQLARLAAIRGNSARATRLNQEATQAFDQYLAQVDEASASVERARARQSSMREAATLVLFGQPLVLNPARLDSTSARIEQIDAAYRSAEQTYAAAGATQEASSIQQERSATLQRLQVTQYGLWGATGIYGLVVAYALLNAGLSLYAYMRDRRTVQLGASLR
ncbi:hypothetical protein DVK02_10715 [Halobellus sp. Atlit-31R]|nr:hypothetical protein DVK02_10715 [Halobellus sp. Atlit-31R]